MPGTPSRITDSFIADVAERVRLGAQPQAVIIALGVPQRTASRWLAIGRGEQAERVLELGPLYEDHDLITAQDGGRPLDPDGFTHAAKKGLVAIGKPKARLHDVRHGHATHLMRAGVSPRQIAERLGHADPALVLRTYAHATLEEDRKAAEKFDAAMQA